MDRMYRILDFVWTRLIPHPNPLPPSGRGKRCGGKFVCFVGRVPSLGCLADGCRTWGCKGDHKGRPYVASFSQSEGRSSFRIIAASFGV